MLNCHKCKGVIERMAFKIGVIVDSFKLGIKEGIQKAREVGASGIQIYATSGSMAPENLTAKQRKELIKVMQSARKKG